MIATHLLSEAKELCDDIVMINRGEIIESFSYRSIEGKEMEIFAISLKEQDQSYLSDNETIISKYDYWISNGRLEIVIAECELDELISMLNSAGVKLENSQFTKVSLEEFYLRKVSGLE